MRPFVKLLCEYGYGIYHCQKHTYTRAWAVPRHGWLVLHPCLPHGGGHDMAMAVPWP